MGYFCKALEGVVFYRGALILASLVLRRHLYQGRRIFSEHISQNNFD